MDERSFVRLLDGPAIDGWIHLVSCTRLRPVAAVSSPHDPNDGGALAMTETITIDEFKYQRAKLSFRYFLDFVKIQDTAPDDGETAGAEMDFILWPHLLFFVRVLELHRSIIVLKARQPGSRGSSPPSVSGWTSSTQARTS